MNNLYAHHDSIISVIESIRKEALKKGKRYNCIAALEVQLPQLEEFAKEEKAEEIPIPIVKIQGMRTFSTRNIDGIATKEWQDGLWEFNNVLALNLSFFICEYDDTMIAKSTVLFADNDVAIELFITKYNLSRWKKNRQALPMVLDNKGERLENFRKATWKSIFLPGDMTDRIKTEVESFFNGQSLYEKAGLDWRRGILLAGRPGTGKTMCCRAVATNASVPVVYCCLNKQDLFDILKELSETIRDNAPCIAIFEDADTLGGNEALRSMFLNMLDGLFSVNGVLTIASTNCPEKLDEALTGRPGRFDSIYIIENPEEREREMILKSKLGNKVKPSDLNHIVSLTKGFSAAAVQEVAVGALLNLVNGKRAITKEILVESVDRLKKHLQAAQDGCERAVHGSVGL